MQLGWFCVRHRAVVRLQLRGPVCYLVRGFFRWVVCIVVVHQSSISLHLVFGKGRCLNLLAPAAHLCGLGATRARNYRPWRRQRSPPTSAWAEGGRTYARASRAGVATTCERRGASIMFRQWLSGARGQGGDLGGRVGNCKKRTRALLKSTQPYLGAVQDDINPLIKSSGIAYRSAIVSS